MLRELLKGATLDELSEAYVSGQRRCIGEIIRGTKAVVEERLEE